MLLPLTAGFMKPSLSFCKARVREAASVFAIASTDMEQPLYGYVFIIIFVIVGKEFHGFLGLFDSIINSTALFFVLAC